MTTAPTGTLSDTARRAYEISQSDEAGTPEENWQRAEHQLRGEAGADPPPT